MLTGRSRQGHRQFAGTELKRRVGQRRDLYVPPARRSRCRATSSRRRRNRRLRAAGPPGYAPAVVLQAQLKAMDKDIDGALALLDECSAKDPADARAGPMRGELLWRVRGDRDESGGGFRQVIGRTRLGAGAHLSRGRARRATEEAAGTKPSWEEGRPSHPDTLPGKRAPPTRRRDFRGASDIAARLVKGMPDNPIALEIAGASAYQLRGFTSRQTQLARRQARARPRAGAQLLAQTYLRTWPNHARSETVAAAGRQREGRRAQPGGGRRGHRRPATPKRADEAFRRAALPPRKTRRYAPRWPSRARPRPAPRRRCPNWKAWPRPARPARRLRARERRLAQKGPPARWGDRHVAEEAARQRTAGLPAWPRSRAARRPRRRRQAFEAALAKDKELLRPSPRCRRWTSPPASRPTRAKRFEALLQSDPQERPGPWHWPNRVAQGRRGRRRSRRHLDEAVKAAPRTPRRG